MSKYTYVVLDGDTKIAGPLPWGNGGGVTVTGVADIVQMLTAAGYGANLKIKQVESSTPSEIGKVWPNPKSRNPEAQKAAGMALAARLGLVPSVAQVEVHCEPLSARQAEHHTRFFSQGGRGRTMYSDQDTSRLIDALKLAFPKGSPGRKFESWSSPAMNVLDCVLSLNRHYERICEPRLNRFNAAHPEVETLAQLTQLIGRYRSPLHFSIAELDYRDEGRAATLVGVLDYLERVKNTFQGESEQVQLLQWAESVTPEDYQTPGVRGFGLAGFQYLRMLFGAQTAKPDVHICRFISEAVGRKVDPAMALTLLEIAAKRLGWPLLELDNEIWELRAQSGKLK